MSAFNYSNLTPTFTGKELISIYYQLEQRREHYNFEIVLHSHNILAIFIFSIIFFFRGESLVQPYVGQVVDESPAYNAGLKKGDEIIYADGNEILYFNDLRNYVLENPSSEIELTIIRDGLEAVSYTHLTLPTNREV